MPCYHPLHAFKAKTTDQRTLIVFNERSKHPRALASRERIELPCGQCVGCRLERSRQWAMRCMHEASLYSQNSFVTLTYSNENLPKDGSLQLRDFQLFMKRLRKANAPKKIRFYHCGEYGETFSRPHYHALLFNHDFDRKQLFSQRNGNHLYTSSDLSNLWPYGFAVTGSVTFESAAYVARYVMKKVIGDRAEEHYQGRKPEYTTMSRRPGIGKGWLEKFSSDVYPRDRVVVRGHFSRPPRFYDSQLGLSDPAALALIKINRELNALPTLYDNSDVRLLVKEEVKEAALRKLIRPLEVVK